MFYFSLRFSVIAGDDQDISPVEIPLVDLQLVGALVELGIGEAALRILPIGIAGAYQAAKSGETEGQQSRS